MFVGRIPNQGLRVHTGIRAGGPGDGGGAGGTAGGGQGGQGAGALTMEAIEEKFNSMIQGAVSSMSKRIEKQSGTQITAAMEGFTKTLEDKLKGFAPGNAGEGGEGGEGGSGGGGKGGKQSKADLELATMRRQLEITTTTANEIKTAYEKEREKNRASEFRSKVTDALSEHAGIKDPFMAKLALSYLKDEGRLAHEDDGSVVFNDAQGAIPIDMGLKGWAKTDEAKRFQLAAGTKGSGSRPGSLNPGADGSKLTDQDRLRVLNDMLDDAVTR